MVSDIIREINEGLDGLLPTWEKRNIPIAILGDGRGNVPVAGRPGWVYARIQYPSGSEAATHIFAPNVQHVNNNVVNIKRNKQGDWETTGVAQVEASGFFHQFGVSNVGSHQASHQYGAPDMLWLDSRQIMGLLVHPTDPPSLEVYIQAGLIQTVNGWEDLAGQAFDLTALVPSGIGEQRIIVVGYDRSDGSITTLDGDAAIYTGYHPKTVPFSRENVADLITAEADGYFYPLMAVRLLFGQTGVQGWDTFLDLRSWGRDGIVPLEMGGTGEDTSDWVGFHFYNNGVAYPVRCVGEATAPPTVNDDETSAPPFSILSRWSMSVTAGGLFDGVWELVDPTDGAAVWVFQGTAYSEANVSNPPTATELTSAFGSPGTLGVGFHAIVNDNGADTNIYHVAAVNGVWVQSAMTVAA